MSILNSIKLLLNSGIYIYISLRGIALEQLLLGFLECGGCLFAYMF